MFLLNCGFAAATSLDAVGTVPRQAYVQSVEVAEREKLRWARGSDDAVGIHEWSGLDC